MKTILEYLNSKVDIRKPNKPSKDARLCTVKEFICFYAGGLTEDDIENTDFYGLLWYGDDQDHTAKEVLDFVEEWGDTEIYVEVLLNKEIRQYELVITGMPGGANDCYDCTMESVDELDEAIEYAKEEIKKNNY